MALRIALVGPAPPPAGGMATQTAQLARLLTDAGFSVERVRTNAPYRPASVARVPGLRALVRLVFYVADLARVLGRVDTVHVMANSGWSWHLFAVPPILIGRLRGVRVVVNYRGGKLGEFLARRHRIVLPVLARADVVVAPSGFIRDIFARYGVRAEVIPNIIDVERFRHISHEGCADAPHLVVTRNLETLYDIPTAIRAFARVRAVLPGATLTVAGSGPTRAALERLVSELGITDGVRFAGRLSVDEIAELYRTADVMLNPSTVDNMPNSLLEAFASGVPVVTTNVGGIPYIAEDGRTALFVPVGDADAMADGVLRLCHDRGLNTAIRTAARASVEAYTWPAVKPLWQAAYGAEPA